MTSAGVWIQIETHVAKFLDAFLQLGNTGGGVHARALRQHGRANEVVGEQLAHAKAQFVANGGPGSRHIEVANVVRHKAGTRAEDGEVATALFHQAQLVGLNGLAQLVVADHQLRNLGPTGWVQDTGDLAITPVFQRFGGGGVVAVAVNDHGGS